MLNRIAVILRGHKRTWDFTKEHLLSFFNFYAFDVDFFINFWHYENASYDQILEDFKDHNLKKLILEPVRDDKMFYSPWHGPTYLVEKLLPSILYEECKNNYRYDLIIDTRPDICFERNITLDHNICAYPMGIGTNAVVHKRNYMDDICFLTDSVSLNFWVKRTKFDSQMFDEFPDISKEGVHSASYWYAKFYQYHIYQIPWFRALLVRPNIIDISNKTVSLYKASTYTNPIWDNFSKDQKLEYLEKTGILEKEYFFQLHRKMF